MSAPLEAIRRSVALSRMDHVLCLALRGEATFDALDALCPADLYVRDGQMLHTLLLREDATPFADLYVCRDDENAILLVEGPSLTELRAHLEPLLPAGVEVEDLGQAHELLGLNGPYAWELMSELLGPELVGLPYLNFFRDRGWLCFRAGKTGEYGYDLLLPRDQTAEVVARIETLGAELDLGHADLETLDQCALENWFFNIRREGRAPGLTPIELQLQWRVSATKRDYLGAAALAARRAQGQRGRLTAITAPAALAAGDDVYFERARIGEILNAGQTLRGDWAGLALLALPFADARCERFVAGVRGVPLRTVSPPIGPNRSLFVNPQSDSYRTRGERALPPGV